MNANSNVSSKVAHKHSHREVISEGISIHTWVSKDTSVMNVARFLVRHKI